MKTKAIITSGLFLILTLCSACGGASSTAPTPTPVTVQLNWLHYGAFGGLYAADQNGTYADAGLAVTFVEGGPEVDDVARVVAGEAQFGVSGADALILARARGQPVRAIATVLRHSPAVFVAPADSRITRPQDFAGHTVRVTPQIAPSFRTMMARVGVAPDQYTEIVLPSDLALFASGEATVWGVYFNSFAVTLQNAGHELNFIFPEDYGVHFYADTIFTTDALIEQDPELVARFLRATLTGLRYAVENPDAIGPLVTRYAPAADPALESAKMRASAPLIHTGQDQIGWMRPAVWEAMHDTLLEQGVLDEPLDVERVYTTTFLEKVYGVEP